MPTRRQFIRAGLVGGIALSAAGVFLSCSRKEAPSAAVPQGLTLPQRHIVGALVPAILAGALPAADEARGRAVAQTVDGVGVAIAGLSAAAQKELGELFALLDFALARVLLARLRPRWEEAPADVVAAFLQDWRTSRLGLLRSAYAALHDLVLGAWYGSPETWEAIGYPGPPEIL
jgi:hypothetical protein